jgi:hypothetical protein
MKLNLFNIQRSIFYIQHLSIKLLVLLYLNLNLSLNIISQGVSINTSGAQPDVSAILDISNTSQGLLIPRMTTAQRDNITFPSISLLIFNTTTNCFESYVNGTWYSVSCPPACPPPSAPSPGINIPYPYKYNKAILWKWNTVPDAYVYQWSTSPSYPGTGNNTTFSTTYLQTGYTCNTTYSFYVWAASSCGSHSPVANLTQPFNCFENCGSNYTVTYLASDGVAPFDGSTTYTTGSTFIKYVSSIPYEYNPPQGGQHWVTYTVPPTISGADECWILQNLGAASQPASYCNPTDDQAGWYWQFGNPRGWYWNSVNSTLVSDGASWNPNSGTSANWNINNDPCHLLLGPGWRIPDIWEMENFVQPLCYAPPLFDFFNTCYGNCNCGFSAGIWTSQFKFCVPGYLTTAGILINRIANPTCDNPYNGYGSIYWSSTYAGSNTAYYLFDGYRGSALDNQIHFFPININNGGSVRCVNP